MELFVVGLNHETANIAVRERLHVAEKELPKLLDVLGERSEVVERMALATCNRVEVYGVTEGDAESAMAAVVDTLAVFRGVGAAGFAEALYRYTAADAVRHVFRVTCSLDSLVLGEPQILGQVKDAFEAAGFEARLCETAASARAALDDGNFALVVLDVLLPDADGVDVLREMKDRPATNGTPVMILSTEADLRDRATEMLAELAARHQGQTVALVGHTVINRVILLYVIGLGHDRFWRLGQDTCAISVFDAEDGDFTLLSLNDTCHLRQVT